MAVITRYILYRYATTIESSFHSLRSRNFSTYHSSRARFCITNLSSNSVTSNSVKIEEKINEKKKHRNLSSNSVMEMKGEERRKVPHVLSVAGSDSGGGAGIQADIKACAALGVFCSTSITALTAQNTLGVQGVHVIPEDFVYEQMKSVLSDMEVDVVKTGMLPSAKIIQALCKSLSDYPVKALVVDPVMVSTSGDILAPSDILDALKQNLLPMSDIVTPNLKEASVLADGTPLTTVNDMRAAAKVIHSFGPRYVLIKGGHLDTDGDVVDILYDGETYHELRGPRVKTCNSHGTGCTLASCIAAELAKGVPMPAAVLLAKRFVEAALENSRDFVVGKGSQKPFNHLFKLHNSESVQAKQGFKPDDLLLYAVTDSKMNKKWGRSVSEAVESAIKGGATIIQLREKESETKDILEAAEKCLEVSRRHGVPFLVNDRLDVALACNADGVHLGQSDMPVKVARAFLGPNKIIGVSCKTPEDALKAWKEGADYIGCGGIYPTSTKENNQTIGLSGLRIVCESTPLPVVAIGGINASNVHEIMKLHLPNLKGVAVVSALFDRESISNETQNLRLLLQKENDIISNKE